jgi:hypothetical protein
MGTAFDVHDDVEHGLLPRSREAHVAEAEGAGEIGGGQRVRFL